MAATLNDIVTQIQSELGDTDGPSAAQIRRIVNDSIKFYKSRRFYFNEKTFTTSLVADDRTIPGFPSDFLYEIQPGGGVVSQGSSNYVLRKVDTSEYDIIDNDATGRPYAYTVRDGEVQLYFIPNSGYTVTLRYIEDVAEFATDGTDDATSNSFTNNATPGCGCLVNLLFIQVHRLRCHLMHLQLYAAWPLVLHWSQQAARCGRVDVG